MSATIRVRQFQKPLLSLSVLLILCALFHRRCRYAGSICRTHGCLLVGLYRFPDNGVAFDGRRTRASSVANGGDTIPAAPVTMKEPPIEIAEGANKCEIVSCGMGIKETCEITCPADKTPQLRLHPKHRTSMYGVQV